MLKVGVFWASVHSALFVRIKIMFFFTPLLLTLAAQKKNIVCLPLFQLL